MREIMFRGKRTDNGSWETGFLVKTREGTSEEKVFITDKMTGYCTPVFPETVGECTGLCDKNGVKIFEGDILKYTVDDYEHICRVVFDDTKSAFVGYSISKNSFNYNIGCVSLDKLKNIEIIGDALSNPELLITEKI